MKKLKLSGRSRRAEHFKGLHSRTGLNLVALMDIFTILVFFLLVSSGSQELPTSKDITLPTSVAKKVPKETLTIAITRDVILLGGRKVVDIGVVLDSKETVISLLKEELILQSSKRFFSDADDIQKAKAITIMGDESIPYRLLRKILATCRQANYTRVSFAAYRRVKD